MNQLKPILKKILGVALIIFGFVALILPLVPFSWVAFIGFELLGIKILPWRPRFLGGSKNTAERQD